MTGLALFELCAVLALVLGFGVVFPYFMDDMRYESTQDRLPYYALIGSVMALIVVLSVALGKELAERAGAVVTVPGGLK